MEPEKIYLNRSFNANMYLGLGIVILGVSLFMGLLPQTGLGVLFIIIGIKDRDRPVLKLFYDYLEFKPGIAAPLEMIRYSNIYDVELLEKKIIIRLKPGTAKKPELKIDVRLLEKKDLPEIMAEVCRRKEAFEPVNVEI